MTAKGKIIMVSLNKYRLTQLVRAIRVTKQNYDALVAMDCDGVLSEDTKEECIGSWFVEMDSGYQLMNNDEFQNQSRKG